MSDPSANSAAAWRALEPDGLIPLPTSRSYNARDGNVAEKLRYDVTALGVNEIRSFMVAIAGGETAQQIELGNPPAFVNVDGSRGTSVTQAQRRITITYGVRLAVEALNLLKAGLVAAIAASTNARTGTLANPANWHYTLNGRPLPLTGASGIPMGPKDVIVLMPTDVVGVGNKAYATAANMRVAGSGRLSFRRSNKPNAKVRKRDQSIGFLALAARSAQASQLFSGFRVSAGMTVKHAIPGEVTRIGGAHSGFIMIRPNVGRSRRG